jgi:ABC-type branched-subunit amino acid transport system substrate-binding protein/transcriptional regulator with XRE-family HTH domain
MKKAAQAIQNEKLLRERLQRHWSQLEVADMIGTTRVNVSRWECGVTTPNPYFRQRLCELFGKSAEELGINPKAAGESSSLATESPVAEPAVADPLIIAPLVVASLLEVETASTPIAEQEKDTPVAVLNPEAIALPEQAIKPDQPLHITATPLHNLSHKPLSTRTHIAIFVSILSLGISLLSASFFLLNSRVIMMQTAAHQTMVWQKELAQETQYTRHNGIGLSDGSYVFDTYAGLTDVALKKQAASQLQQHDTSGAVNSLTQAVSTDANDGEAQIYNEDLHVLQSGSPYVTLVLGLAIDNNSTDLLRARSIMKAAYLAQHEVNTEGLLPNNLRLRILIDNSGTNDANVATVAQFIANRVNDGNPDHIIGVIGWPLSIQTMDALDIIVGAHIPMISQTASSVLLSGSNSYFFRLNASDYQQGKILGMEAVNRLHARNILLVRDPADPYSVSLTNAFSNSVVPLNVNLINDASASSFTERQTTVEKYQQNVVQDAIAKKADLIFMAGFDVDAIRLAHAIGNASREDPQNTQLANLKVLSGDAVATSLMLGQGNGPDAAIARNFPQDMQRLIFSTFAHPNEWNFAKVPTDQQPTFFSNWARTYCSIDNCYNSTYSLDENAMLTYDALKVFATAASLVHSPLTGSSVRQALASLGQEHIPAFQGVSGLIQFDSQGNPVSKVVVLLGIQDIDGSNSFVLQGMSGTLSEEKSLLF